MNLTHIGLTLILMIAMAPKIGATEVPAGLTASSITAARTHQLVDQREFDSQFFDQAIKHQTLSTRLFAIRGLARIGGEQVIPLITPLLKDKNEDIRHAAVFAIGLSGSLNSQQYLWPLLKTEKSKKVKQEIYLSLGNLVPSGVISKLLKQLPKENDIDVKTSILQALSIAITFNQTLANNIDMKKSQSTIDFEMLLSLMERDDKLSYQAGYFLARIKNIDKRISPAQLQKFIHLSKNIDNKKIVARLIGKVTKRKHLANRRLLSWLIEQSEQQDIALATEAIRAMGNMLYIPQAKIQLGKLHASSNTLVAQTALKTLADSELEGREITSLLKKQLKSKNSGMVVEAMSGLIKRQTQADMTWALKILGHKDTYVKVRFCQLVFNKDKQAFNNVLTMFSNDADPKVASYARGLLKSAENNSSRKKGSPPFEIALKASDKILRLKTTAGNIDIKLNKQAIFTAANFLELARKGYYDNSYFSRVIGNFVAQGGDTIGDGNGSSNLSIREEISYLSHKIGSVGMATSGKDTGDSQFFINTANNTHLDRNYTVFAEVIDGLNNALKLSNGDKIISIEEL